MVGKCRQRAGVGHQVADADFASAGTVPCCADTAIGASDMAPINDAESRFLIGIFLDCQSERTATRLPIRGLV